MKSIYYFTNIAPLYREEIWKRLASHDRCHFTFVFGDGKPTNFIKCLNLKSVGIENKVIKVRNIYFKRVLVWQIGVLSLVLTKKMDIVMLLGDMHVLSNWLVALICKVRKIKVIYWGHGFNGGERLLKRIIRIQFNKLADEHFLYGKRARKIMVGLGFDVKSLHVVYNSLSYSKQYKLRKDSLKSSREEVMTFFDNPNLPILTFIGRITPVKKIHLLIEAVQNLNAIRPMFNCLIIGSGSDLNSLKGQFLNEACKGYVYFYGECFNEMENSKLIALSDLCVSPGNIGLTGVHCMTYGTPCATNNNLVKQMPEFEVIEAGKTGFYFEEDDVADLSISIKKWFSQTNYDRNHIRSRCYEIVDKFYNPNYQISLFDKVFFKS